VGITQFLDNLLQPAYGHCAASDSATAANCKRYPSTNYATRPMPVIAFGRPHAVHCRCRLALVTNNTSPCSRPEFFVH